MTTAILSSAQYTAFFNRLQMLARQFYRLEAQETQLTLYGSISGVTHSLLGQYTTDAAALLNNLYTDSNNTLIALDSFKEALCSYSETLISDLGTDLNATVPSDIQAVLTSLIRAMLSDGKTVRTGVIEVASTDLETVGVDGSVASDGTIIKHSSNLGTGKLVHTFKRPNEPQVSEIASEDWINVECINAAVAGSETFAIKGRQAQSRSSYLTQGSGSGTTMTVAGNSITNGGFETWIAGPLPGTWTVNDGDYTTDYIQGTSQILRGASALELVAAGGTVKLTQPVTLLAGGLYCMSFWAKKAASATGNIKLQITNATGSVVKHGGAALNPNLTTDIEIAKTIAGLSSSAWTFYNLIFDVPTNKTEQWYLTFEANTVAVANAYIDDIQLTAMTQHNNMYWALFAGATDFGVGDKFGYGTDDLGVKVQVQACGPLIDRAGSVSDSYYSFVIPLVDKTAEFPAGSFIKHPYSNLWYSVFDSEFSTSTTVSLNSTSPYSWASVAVQAFKKSPMQEFLKRIVNIQLPSSASPNYGETILG